MKRQVVKITPEDALVRLERMCVRAEHCTAEMRQKLRQWGISDSDADSVVCSLVDRRFVDDARYAAAFVRDRYRFARYGRVKIGIALKTKHISPDIIAEAMEEIDSETYLDILRSVISAKAKSLPRPLSMEDRNRIFRHAISRGYESALVSKIIKELG